MSLLFCTRLASALLIAFSGWCHAQVDLDPGARDWQRASDQWERQRAAQEMESRLRRMEKQRNATPSPQPTAQEVAAELHKIQVQRAEEMRAARAVQEAKRKAAEEMRAFDEQRTKYFEAMYAQAARSGRPSTAGSQAGFAMRMMSDGRAAVIGPKGISYFTTKAEAEEFIAQGLGHPATRVTVILRVFQNPSEDYQRTVRESWQRAYLRFPSLVGDRSPNRSALDQFLWHVVGANPKRQVEYDDPLWPEKLIPEFAAAKAIAPSATGAVLAVGDR